MTRASYQIRLIAWHSARKRPPHPVPLGKLALASLQLRVSHSQANADGARERLLNGCERTPSPLGATVFIQV
ncbi:MAG: hypothetical protein ACLPX9_22375, partial [Rhodomicrobium sp.]